MSSLFAILFAFSFAADGLPYKGSTAKQSVDACHEIKLLCMDAGYYEGGHAAKKGLILDCAHPLLEGKSIPEVKASPELIARCKKDKKKN